MIDKIIKFVIEEYEDISERISLFKLFGGFLFSFALYYSAFWFVTQSDTNTTNEITLGMFDIKFSNALGSLAFSVLTCIITLLFVGRKKNL